LRDLKTQIIKNQKLVICGVIALCLLLADYMFFLKPSVLSLIKTVPQLRNLKNQLATDRNLAANIQSYKIQIERMRNMMSSYKKKFSTAQETAYLLKGLSDMAKESHIKIAYIKPHPAVETRPAGASAGVYHKFPISIKAVCGFHQLGVFLSKLENDETFMRVSDLKISSDEKDPSSHLVYILVNTYLLSGA
jgi:Tfp pilus assembly protein PilO